MKYLSTTLGETFTNTNLTSIKITSGRYTKKLPQNLKKLRTALPLKIESIKSYGKFFYITLNKGFTLNFTLGLTGSFYKTCAGKTLDERGIEVNKYCRIRFDTTKGPFFFSDMRNFGTLTITIPSSHSSSHPSSSQNQTQDKLKKLGLDPLQAITPTQKSHQLSQFIQKVHDQRNQSQPIATLLLNQSVLAGVGNYIRAIVLYRSKISPHRPISSLTKTDLTNIYNNTYKIMHASYKKQLTSGLHTYPLTVYRKKTSPAGNPIISDVLPKGRHIYWDPKVQK